METVNYWLLLGELWLPALIVAVSGYFLGCFNGAVIVSKYILRDDVRDHGSGNAGLTNFHRTFGGGLTFVVILCDVLKAVAALLVAQLVWNLFSVPLVSIHHAKYFAGMFCLLGHSFPCMFHFRGGKGILSGGTIALMIDWRVALVVWVGWMILVVLTRYISLGSVYAGASFPVASWFVFRDGAILAMAIVLGGLVVVRHSSNIKRLLAGTESKFSFHKKK